MGVIINTPSKGSKARLIATAPANQTYAAQCATLYTAYQTLTAEEKLKSVIVNGDTTVLQIINLTNATYSRQFASDAVYGETFILGINKHYGSTGTTTNDDSSITHSGTLKLYVLD